MLTLSQLSVFRTKNDLRTKNRQVSMYFSRALSGGIVLAKYLFRNLSRTSQIFGRELTLNKKIYMN